MKDSEWITYINFTKEELLEELCKCKNRNNEHIKNVSKLANYIAVREDKLFEQVLKEFGIE